MTETRTEWAAALNGYDGGTKYQGGDREYAELVADRDLPADERRKAERVRSAPLTVDQANAIYDILVRYAGAPDKLLGDSAEAPVPPRAEFVFHQTRDVVPEYRFMGSLGFGGKFWRTPSAFRIGSDVSWHVTAYREDIGARPERQQVIDDTNRALAELKDRILA